MQLYSLSLPKWLVSGTLCLTLLLCLIPAAFACDQPGESATPTPSSTSPTPTPSVSVSPTPSVPLSPPPTASTPVPSAPGTPRLERLEPVTDHAFGADGQYVPNSWGVHKQRLIRTTTGDLFTVFISAGTNLQNRTWHLMHRAPTSGSWHEIRRGNAGAEPISILRGPHDEIHLFTWPGTQGVLHHLESRDLGQTFTDEVVPGQWAAEQGYSSASINDQGDIVVYQSGEEQPGTFLWSVYSAQNKHWQFHVTPIGPYRYTYAFFFLGEHQDLSIVAMRDVERPLLGYPSASGFNYIFNALALFHINDVSHPVVTTTPIVQVEPRSSDAYDITYLTDSYVDTVGRIHVLYNNLYDGPDVVHHVILQDGRVLKDVKQSLSYALKTRITQDSRGHFYLITIDSSGTRLMVAPGSATDTDGTHLGKPTALDISGLPGCTDDDFCHAPTFTVPRNGHALSDEIDGTYGNFTHEIAFRLRLR